MALARARALRTLQTSLRHSGQRVVPRVSAPTRTQLVQRRYASGGGHGAEAGSDLPWLLGGIIVTVPSCWYLWPDTSHAEHHGGHGEHEEHAEEGGESEEKTDGGESQEQDDQQAEGEVKDSPEKDDKGFEQEEETKQDELASKDNDGDAQDSLPPGGERDVNPNEDDKDDQETKPGGGGGKDDNTKTEQVANERKLKKKPDSGQQLGRDAEDPAKSQAGGAKNQATPGETKHSLPMDSDPNESKKPDGTPDSARHSGTIDPSRDQK